MRSFIPFIFGALFLLSSCGKATSTQNVRVSESSGAWEYVGVIEDASFPVDSYEKNTGHPSTSRGYSCTLHIYLREIAGEQCVGVKKEKSEKDCHMATSNPFYGDGTKWGNYKYRVDYNGKYYYFSF
jgi:hypothetical protein